MIEKIGGRGRDRTGGPIVRVRCILLPTGDSPLLGLTIGEAQKSHSPKVGDQIKLVNTNDSDLIVEN